LQVYHLENSRSQRILWLLEELDLNYSVERFNRELSGRAPPEFRKVHARGKAPILIDGDLILAESGAIVGYIIDRYAPGRLVPKDWKANSRYRFWFNFAEGSATFPIGLLYFVKQKSGSSAEVVDAAKQQVDALLDFIEDELQPGPWFAGEEFSAADIMMSYGLQAAHTRGYLRERHARIKSYLERVYVRPASCGLWPEAGDMHWVRSCRFSSWRRHLGGLSTALCGENLK